MQPVLHDSRPELGGCKIRLFTSDTEQSSHVLPVTRHANVLSYSLICSWLSIYCTSTDLCMKRLSNQRPSALLCNRRDQIWILSVSIAYSADNWKFSGTREPSLDFYVGIPCPASLTFTPVPVLE